MLCRFETKGTEFEVLGGHALNSIEKSLRNNCYLPEDIPNAFELTCAHSNATAFPGKGVGVKTKRTTRTMEITVERDEVHIIRRVGQRKIMWCAECGRETQMMTPEEGMVFAGVNRHTVATW